MKVKLPALTISLTVMVLAISMFGWEYKEKVYASETGNTTVATFSTEYNQLEMPILAIVTNSGDQISSDEVYAGAKISIINDKGIYEMTDMATSVKLRGSSSMYADKKSYKMKFEEKQNLLGIGDGKGKPWLLIANHSDHSLLRNLTAYRFAEKLTGMSYSPNCRSIELYINGEYQGVYLLCEDNNVNKNRVAIEEAPDEVEDNGYLVEMTRYEGENKFDVDTARYVIKSELSDTAAIKGKQINYISNYIKESYTALKNGDQENAKKYIDLDSLVDIYIGNEVVKNVDAGWDSFYMYKDVNGKLCFGPMWDFDLAMGNANCIKGFDSWAGFSPYHVLNVNANSNPWFCNALSNKWFRELVIERWNELQDELKDIPNIVIKEAESNYKSYCRNFEEWDILGKQTNISPEEIVKLPTYKDHYTYLSNWLSKRVSWLAEHYNNEDFIIGIFVKEDGKELSAKSNLVELSSILAFGCSSYEILPNTGIVVSFENGDSSWAQACATGFMLEEGAEYVLSFDYKCNNDLPVPFAVQKNYEPWSAYYSQQINMTNKLQHFEGTFTATANDSNCALAFSFGDSTNGTVATLENMSLVKKSATESIIGDIDGNGAVNMSDVVLMAVIFNSVVGDGYYKASCDLNNDGAINMADAVIIAVNFNKTIND